MSSVKDLVRKIEVGEQAGGKTSVVKNLVQKIETNGNNSVSNNAGPKKDAQQPQPAPPPSGICEGEEDANPTVAGQEEQEDAYDDEEDQNFEEEGPPDTLVERDQEFEEEDDQREVYDENEGEEIQDFEDS